jgi:hypothetical protein
MTVRVKTREEIQATLDDHGRLDGLPFQGEMWQYCGHTFSIAQVINRIYIEKGTVRKLAHTVILSDVRCSGLAHSGCQRRCLLLFKQDWLRPVAPNEARNPCGDVDDVHEALASHADMPCQGQSTVLTNATTPLPFWDVRQYIADLQAQRFSARDFMRMLAYMWLFHFRRTHPKPRQGSGDARQSCTPSPEVLNLQAGEWVEVRTADEIASMLDAQGKYRGLYFSAEGMARYCGKRYRVSHRVERMIDEVSERSVNLSNTVALEGVTCDGIGLRGCPRDCYWLWREAWLKRAPSP